MNLHPVFVHFPVALLTIYALMELVRFKKIMSKPYWFYLKAVILMVGGLGALAAYFTGNMAKFAVRQGEFVVAIPNFKQVVSLHQNFAALSVAIFGILAASYLILWLNRENISRFFLQKQLLMKFWQTLAKIAHAFVETKFVIFLVLAGLICITITGGLGGIMVYGTSADPFFGVIYHLLFPGM